eukprot:UN06239
MGITCVITVCVTFAEYTNMNYNCAKVFANCVKMSQILKTLNFKILCNIYYPSSSKHGHREMIAQ